MRTLSWPTPTTALPHAPTTFTMQATVLPLRSSDVRPCASLPYYSKRQFAPALRSFPPFKRQCFLPLHAFASPFFKRQYFPALRPLYYLSSDSTSLRFVPSCHLFEQRSSSHFFEQQPSSLCITFQATVLPCASCLRTTFSSNGPRPNFSSNSPRPFALPFK